MTNIFSSTKISQISNVQLSISYHYSWIATVIYYVRWAILPIILIIVYFTKIEMIALNYAVFAFLVLSILFLILVLAFDYKQSVKITKNGLYFTDLNSQKSKFIGLDNRKAYHFTVRIKSDYALINLNYLTIKISEIEKLPLVIDTIAKLWKLRFKSSVTLRNNKEVMTYISKKAKTKKQKDRQNQNSFKHRKNLNSQKSQHQISQFSNQKGRNSLRRTINYRRN